MLEVLIIIVIVLVVALLIEILLFLTLISEILVQALFIVVHNISSSTMINSKINITYIVQVIKL